MPLRLLATTNRPSTLLSSAPAASVPPTNTDSSTPTATQDGQVHLGASTGKSSLPTRPPSTRPVTPTKQSFQYRADIQRKQANRSRREQAKAIDASAKNGSKRKGKGKGRASAASRRISIDEDEPEDDAIEEDEDFDYDDDDDDDEEEPNGGNSTSVVPTSDPRELIGKITGETYGDELEDLDFCNSLAGKINGILNDKEKRKQFSRETLQEALRIVRRAPSTPHGPSQFISSITEHPTAAAKEVTGGSGYHTGREPQSGDKRLSDASQAGSSKRGRVEPPRTPSTAPEVTPPPFGLGSRPGASAPPGLPRTAVRPQIAMPKGLPRTKAMFVDRSPSPLPACFRAAPADTQTMAENTQTVPEDTQTVPEDTQTVPEETQPTRQGHPDAGGAGPLPPSSSPDLGAPPSVARRLPPVPAVSLDGDSVSQAAPVTRLSLGNSTQAEKLEKMAAEFEKNQRYRLQAYAMLRDRSGSQLAAAKDLFEEDAIEKADARRKAKGMPTKPKKKKKAGLNCQGGYPSQAASRAVADMTAFLFAVGPYVPSGSLLVISMEAYNRAFREEFPGIPVEEPIAELISAIAERAPGARTVAKLNLRPLMTAKAGYGFHADPDTQAKINENVRLYESIREDFHYGSLSDPQSHYEHPALKAGFVQAFFKDRYAACAIYYTYFKPAATMQSIGVLLALMESCVAEWSTGKFRREQLNSKVQGVVYEKHMRNLRVFAHAAPSRFERMCKTFYEAGYKNAVQEGTADSGDNQQPTIRPQDIRPDTPPPVASTSADGDDDIEDGTRA